MNLISGVPKLLEQSEVCVQFEAVMPTGRISIGTAFNAKRSVDATSPVGKSDRDSEDLIGGM